MKNSKLQRQHFLSLEAYLSPGRKDILRLVRALELKAGDGWRDWHDGQGSQILILEKRELSLKSSEVKYQHWDLHTNLSPQQLWNEFQKIVVIQDSTRLLVIFLGVDNKLRGGQLSDLTWINTPTLKLGSQIIKIILEACFEGPVADINLNWWVDSSHKILEIIPDQDVVSTLKKVFENAKINS